MSPDPSFGHSVACAGDLNEDGLPEVVVGAIEDSRSQDCDGAVFVFSLELADR